MAKEDKSTIIIVKRKKKARRRTSRRRLEGRLRRLRDRDDGLLSGDVAGELGDQGAAAAIFDYFKNPSMEPGHARGRRRADGPGGASTAVINMGGGMDAPRVTIIKSADANAKSKPQPFNLTEADEAAAKKIADEADHKKLESLMAELRQAIDKSQALQPFKDQLLLDITPEGLRIQIVDKQNRPMFDLGSAKLRDYTETILKTLAGYLNTVPNRISLTGHTDIRPYAGGHSYTNWELSADRANAARRALEAGGLAGDKIARVVGLSSSVLFDKVDAQNPINRRISIIVMTKQAEDSALRTESRPEMPSALLSPDIAAPAGPPATRATPPAAAPAPAAPAAVTPAPAPARGRRRRTGLIRQSRTTGYRIVRPSAGTRRRWRPLTERRGYARISLRGQSPWRRPSRSPSSGRCRHGRRGRRRRFAGAAW